MVGRKEECDLRLDHKSVSKMHCIIVKTDDLLLLRDLQMLLNSTRVNGQRVRRAILLPNDQVSIANYKFRVFLGPDHSEPPAPARPDDHTQRIEPGDVAEMLRKVKAHEEKNLEDSAELPAMPLQRNNLPDVYEGDDKG